MASSNTPGGGGIDLPTLVITAAASAAAAYTCSKIWAPGTLASAAFMPVLVALLKEALAKPTYAVTRAVPVRGVVRSATSGEAPAGEPPEHIEQRIAQQGEVDGRSRSVRRRGWQTAIVTGLLGFLVAAVIITVPEVVAGESATGGGRETTLFGGGDQRSSSEPAETTTAPTQTQTVPPAETVTVPPAETVTVPPADTTTVPPQTTTVPPETTTPVPETTTPLPETTTPVEPLPPG